MRCGEITIEVGEFIPNHSIIYDINIKPDEMINNVSIVALDGGSIFLVKYRIEESKICVNIQNEYKNYKVKNRSFRLRYSIVPRVNSLHRKKMYDTIIEKNSNMCMSFKSLYNNYYKKGVIFFDPDYQRDFVWTEKQQEDYILNLFYEMAEIRPTIVEYYDESGDYVMEILDGKQRLTTLIMFLEDKIRCCGHLFSELCESDRKFILNYNVRYTRINARDFSKPSNNTLYQLFYEINVLGTKISDSHIDKIKNKLVNEGW